MIGTCIIALVFSPILAEFLAYFNHDCRGFLRSDKAMAFGSFCIEPRTFRAIAFAFIFLIIYPSLRYLVGKGFSLHSDLGYLVSYLCFMAIIEPLIIYINKDEEAKVIPKEPFPDWFSMKTRLAMLSVVVVTAACADSLLWSACFKKPLERDPNVYREFVKKIPLGIREQAIWFATH